MFGFVLVKINNLNFKKYKFYVQKIQLQKLKETCLTLIYATGGMSAPVNIVTSVNMHVTSKVTRPGIASRPSQKLNHDNITTKDDGAKVCIK